MKSVHRMKRHALRLAGHFFVLLGLVGAFVPLLPTTPFLLLAAACYVRSSPHHHEWIMATPVFGRAIQDYQQNKAVTVRTKLVALSVLWLSLLFSASRAKHLVAAGVIFGIGVLLSALILRLRTLRRSDAVEQASSEGSD